MRFKVSFGAYLGVEYHPCPSLASVALDHGGEACGYPALAETQV